MNCVICEKPTKVIDTRAVERCVCRKRKCLHCGFEFCTSEVYDPNAKDELNAWHRGNRQRRHK